jgi:4-deoxy-L-threo-5-hexosulose-uronate ketol-isomerase
MPIRILPDALRYAALDSAALRENFLVESLFEAGRVNCLYCDTDRAVIGAATPLGEPLWLGADAKLRTTYFAERRELGVLNIGGSGSITVDGARYAMENRDCLYVGRGSRNVTFESADPATPAQFYLLSYPAHAAYPTAQARQADAEAVAMGTDAACNRRTIYKYIHPAGIQSCQLVMGFTELAEGSVWNTMPAHTHLRRSEVYLYFDLAADARVVHLMGTPEETRHLIVANEQVVVSPPWSIHSGVGTSRYSFCWGMGGENQEFTDMDGVPVERLR